MELSKIQTDDSKVHAAHIAKHLHDLKDHCRSDIEGISDPKAKALFETTAEVLGGLEKAMTDYQEQTEKAWR
jgi:hypothetical protein